MTILIQYKQTLGEQHFDIDLRLPAKGITAVFGRSGAGKTSLINVVAGLTQPDSGHISINGKVLYDSIQKLNVLTHRRNIGYVFQEARLFPHFSVKGNLKYGCKAPDDDYFQSVVSLLALTPLLDRLPNQLSGGERQRVAIGRALLSKPDLLLMDEPLASLDLPRKREVLPFLEQLSNTVDVPILYVSHSLNEVLRLAENMVVIDQGKVAASGTLEQVWASQAMTPWQSFSEQSSLFQAVIAEHNHDYALSSVQLAPEVSLWVQKIDGHVGDSVRLQVRSNDVSLVLEKPTRTSIRNIISATIESIETLQHGDKQSVSVSVKLAPECRLVATITAWARDDLGLKPGMPVYVQIKGVSVTQKDVVVA
ncbi:molybdenum ABC transporter ATP-binding protein ModC [Vibrio sp. MarTm2]|uniref:molybdenum ABC transporter ATP-binding protein ModC n=1 Tax=Vibrio sp. MarTm2 TaxID=2998831 RepID=UPI0022CD44F1|nr:molybdenum ABC transporter ATP-binding protein ModC [Vibrio sp. MarTm2]MDA0128682.1 molybdenum ABC transporter ATP-binding protein ModC [Vibrio sp. MarTm2]